MPSYLDVTGNAADTDLVGPGDNALTVNGWFGVAAQAQFSATTGEEFWLESFAIVIGGMAPNAQLVGYRDGVAVVSQNFEVTSSTSIISTSGDEWKNIDEFRIVQENDTSDISFYIYDITVSDAVLPNDAPVIGNLGGDSVSFTENGGAVLLDAGSDATVSDSDSADFDGGSIVVAIIADRVPGEDVLSVQNEGSAAGQVGVSGSSVFYGGVKVGDMTGGTGTNDLVISLNNQATPNAVQAILRKLTYANTNLLDPSTASRAVQISVSDGDGGSTTQTTAMDVVSVNNAPVASVPSSISVTEDVASALTGISFSDADAGGGTVTATFSVGSGTLAATSGGGVIVGGSSSALTLSGTIANINAFIGASNVIFTTAANATSDVTLTVSINDGGNSGSGGAQTDSDTVTLQVAAVNDAPLVTTPLSINVNEDVVTALTGISFADIDAGGSTVTATFSVGSGTLAGTSGSGVLVDGSGTGSLTLSGSIADINSFIAASALSFQTALNSTSNVVLIVDVFDHGNTGSGGNLNDTDTVTLMVTAVNDAPVNSAPAATQAVDQDAALIFSGGNGNLISISDVDAGGGTVRVTLTASNGLITLPGTTGLSFNAGSGANDGTMEFEGTIADINAALNGTIFSPTPGYNGAASLQIITVDRGFTGTGGTQTDTDTIAITVSGLNPEVTSVNVTNPDGVYKEGDVISVTVTFDQAVTVNTAGGIPSLLLETGGLDRSAAYVSGSGSNTLTLLLHRAGGRPQCRSGLPIDRRAHPERRNHPQRHQRRCDSDLARNGRRRFHCGAA
jgi:hypothetical protein